MVVPTPSEKPTCDIGFFGKNKRCETHNRVFAISHPCPGPIIATPEKPTCKHGETGGHDDIVYTPAGQRLIYCHGPVISTPEKCKIEEESGFCAPHESYECPHGLSGDHPDGVLCDCVCHSTPTPSEKSTIYKCVCRYSGTNVKTRKDGEDDYWTCPGCKTEYGPVKPYPGPVIATEPETPVFGETCKNCHEPIYRDGVYRHCDDDKVDCTLMAEPVSDPSPELRERIARVLYAQDSDAGPVFYAQEYAETVDAVLAALKAEPK